MSTFHLFPRLPLELRNQIWRCTAEPRTVEVRIKRQGSTNHRFFISPTPIPGPLQCCREARDELQRLYQRISLEGNTQQGFEQRYVWLNFNIDMVDIGPSYFDNFESIIPAIKRIKFERENSNEYFYHTEKEKLRDFTNVEEIHVVCADGFWQWSEALYDLPWPCAFDKLVFFDPWNGQVAKGMELERICRQMLKDARLAATGVAFSSDDESDG
ncbi:glycosyl hydrolase family 18 [Pyrenophora seminiperda CCB06]|uniref:Glycosyl hydrolase family 18 n=1 Tax=Pyrenophora seminiperda CCB06 TaxID=1302712 RepID=A0A3M7M6F8_9PLEO|nr:glycosyl hydrolase family 18 [Pyrenophora seminiperda CCB06]